MGFRSMTDIVSAFSVKLWWRFRQNSSLWAKFMTAKYVRNAHLGMVGDTVGASATWRRMLLVRDLAEQHITFVIRSGSSNFWFDNWLGTGPIAEGKGPIPLPNVKIRDLFDGTAWHLT